MSSRNIAQRLKRLEAALTPAAPQILIVRGISSATGEVFYEHHLKVYPPNHRGETGRWTSEEVIPDQGEPVDHR